MIPQSSPMHITTENKPQIKKNLKGEKKIWRRVNNLGQRHRPKWQWVGLVSMDDPRTRVLDPSDPIPERGLNLSLNRVNVVLRNPLSPLWLRVTETPRLRRRGCPAVTRPSHLTRNRRHVALTTAVAFPAHYLNLTLTRPVIHGLYEWWLVTRRSFFMKRRLNV